MNTQQIANAINPNKELERMLHVHADNARRAALKCRDASLEDCIGIIAELEEGISNIAVAAMSHGLDEAHGPEDGQ